MKKNIYLFLMMVVTFCACAGEKSNGVVNKSTTTLQTQTNANKSVRVKITINEKTLYATFDDNATSRAILAQMPLTLTMENLYGDEMCYRYQESLPTDNVQTYIHKKGEIFYWPPRHSFVIRYIATNETLNIQHIGQIDDGVDAFANVGTVSVKFEIVE